MNPEKQAITYEKDADGIVHLIMDRPDGSANIMDDNFTPSLQVVVEKLRADDYQGVILRSAKKTFFAGGNLDGLYHSVREDAPSMFAEISAMKALLRELETQGKPVVAAINGAALGGGWELALTSHCRIVLDQPSLKLGLPEVNLGLLPGAGGVIRMTRMLGLEAAMPYLLEGKLFSPAQALEAGLVNELAASPEELLEKAKAWIQANPEVQQPWDQQGYKVPGGLPGSPKVAAMLPVVPAVLQSKTKSCYPAPEAILCTMVEGLQVDFETALRIESRYFIELATGQVAKNIIGAHWFGMNQIKAGASRPDGFEQQSVKKVGVLGAGMMGAGIAYACAVRGIDVVLKDVSLKSAEKGKDYTRKLLDKKISRGRMTEARKESVLALVTATDQADDLQGCDLVIEAVFEDKELKANVTREAEARLSSDAIYASNTSTLPITGLAQASERPANFIGLHFFSPVDKMQLVEIICGEKTADSTLARAYDFVLQIGKTPIVVNDSRGFFTSRVFATYTREGAAMVGEGVPAAAIENAAFLQGFPVGPLAITDEVNMALMARIRNQTIRAQMDEGQVVESHPADAVIDRMLEQERAGKLGGKGFYEYPAEGRKYLWAGLKEQFERPGVSVSLQDIKDRLIFIQAVEAARCHEEKVVTSARDANIGSILGIGTPSWTGGLLQFINQYGVQAFVDRARELADNYGERFLPPESLVSMAGNGEIFAD